MIEGILFEGYGQSYLSIVNNGGKVWILPMKNLRMALALYQPSSNKGNILKKWLPFVKVITPVLGKLGIENKRLILSDKFRKMIEEIFQQNRLEFAFFLGTPGTHQKITIQIFSDNRILGYCKLSSNPAIINIFINEKKNLDFLKQCSVHNIPECLYCGLFDDVTYMFVQTTVKNKKSDTYHEIRDAHISFLNTLKLKTEVRCEYCDSDFYKTMTAFQHNIRFFPGDIDRKIIDKVIKIIEDYLKSVCLYSFYHGDFTAWNTFITKSKIFAFDFEYAKRSYPPMIDIFHFFTQGQIYETNHNSLEIVDEFKKLFVDGSYENVFKSPEINYMMYLIDIINLYLDRDKGNFSNETKTNLQIRYEILSKCCELNETKIN